MTILEKKDFLEIKTMSLVADYDKKTIIQLYQPIIGYAAAIIYFTFLEQLELSQLNNIINHETLFKKMGITTSAFVEARKKLEAYGLLKTYLTKNSGDTPNLYVYCLFAPKTPQAFFMDELFSTKFKEAVGENEYNKIKILFSSNSSKEIEGEDISASYYSVNKKNSSANMLDRESGHVVSDFAYEKFFEALESKSQIKKSAISSQQMKEIERLALLNGVNEYVAADIVADLYNPGAKEKIDMKKVRFAFEEQKLFGFTGAISKTNVEANNGDTRLAAKVTMMEEYPPKIFLSNLQNGTKPAPSDLGLVNSLSVDFQLPNGVINALLDYVLTVNDNVLSRPLAQKIAASLKREGVETAVDAMNYLIKIHNKTKKTSPAKAKVEKKESEENLDWDEIIESLEGK